MGEAHDLLDGRTVTSEAAFVSPTLKQHEVAPEIVRVTRQLERWGKPHPEARAIGLMPTPAFPKGARLRQVGRGWPGATVRARMPRVARSASSETTGKIPESFHSCSTEDQS